MTNDARRSSFQGSETSSAEVTFYPLGEEDFFSKQGKPIKLIGRRRGDDDPSLVSCSTAKMLGRAAGSFTVMAKSDLDLGFEIPDDTWCDIVMTRHDHRYHVMRGLVDSVRRTSTIGANGATVQAWQITGRDFGKIFEDTPIWFDRFTDASFAGAALNRLFSQNSDYAGTVGETVRDILLGFLAEKNNRGRSNWVIPAGLPLAASSVPALPLIGIGGSVDRLRFADVVYFFQELFMDDPPRAAVINSSLFDAQNSSLWQTAFGFSDPMLCEFYCDLIHRSQALLGRSDGEIEEYDVRDTQMAVILRDRPFLTFERHRAGTSAQAPSTTPEPPELGPWFRDLPLYRAPLRSLSGFSPQRSGTERLNTFFAAPALTQETLKNWPDLQLPLVHQDDVLRHGMRRLDAVSNYISTGGATPDDSILTMASAYRRRIRDFYCLNHLFRSGPINFAHGRPDIRIGGKLRIEGPDPEEWETFYVERVAHNWSLMSGVTTQVLGTRGWRGTDQSLVSALQAQVAEYSDRRGNLARIDTGLPIV